MFSSLSYDMLSRILVMGLINTKERARFER